MRRFQRGELNTLLTFAIAAQNVSFYQVGDNASGVVAQVDVFTNNVYTATQNIMGDNLFSVPNLVDLTAYSNVTSIRIHSVTDPGGLGWDNFSFTQAAAVPAPAALGLLGVGLALLGIRRRSR